MLTLEETATCAKTQLRQFSQLVDPEPRPDLQVTGGHTRLQHPIASPLGLGAPGAVCRGGRGQKLQSKALLRLSLSSPDLRSKTNRGHKQERVVLESLKERVVMKSFLPDHLKADCLERMDQVKHKSGQSWSPEAVDEKLTQRTLPSAPRGRLGSRPNTTGSGVTAAAGSRISTPSEGTGEAVSIPGGFHCGELVMARHEILVGEDNEVMAMAFDQAVVLGPSSSIDLSRVCVQFQEKRDVELLPYNAALDEIMSADNGRLMQMPVPPPPRAETPLWMKKAKKSARKQEDPAAWMLLPPLTPSEAQFDSTVFSEEPGAWQEQESQGAAASCGWICQLALGTSVQAGAAGVVFAGDVRKRALQRLEDSQTYAAMRRVKALESSQSLPNLLMRS